MVASGYTVRRLKGRCPYNPQYTNCPYYGCYHGPPSGAIHSPHTDIIYRGVGVYTTPPALGEESILKIHFPVGVNFDWTKTTCLLFMRAFL